MIKQGIVNDSILEKKFKILRTSILLGNIKDRTETIASYESTAREIDKIKRSVYEELLASKMYTATTLEEEEKRLKELTQLIENRVRERNDFIDDYIKITSNFLDDLPKVSLESELPDYKLRLENIDEYLNNCNEIEKENKKLKDLKAELQEKYENKANNEIINSKLEDELIEEFNKIVAKNSYYSSLNYPDIDGELIKIDASLNEKRDVMNTFISSYDALKNAGISGAEREEYLSYVSDAKSDYYDEAEKKYFLNIYKLVLDRESDYEALYQKRLSIENILKEREKCRRELEISSIDELEYFTNLCDEQFSVIKSQKFNIENIDKLVLQISDCEERLQKLEEANNRKEIVDLLKEFSVSSLDNIDDDFVAKDTSLELPENDDNKQVVLNFRSDLQPKPNNMVVSIKDPVKINVKTATDTAKLVMKKVVIVLEPKKFNGKRDKLKEAERELEERKQREKELLNKQSEKKIELAENIVDVNENSNEIFNDKGSSIDENNIFVEYKEEPMINLNTQEVKNDKDVKDTIFLDEVKINTPENNDGSVVTEIFVEEEPKTDTTNLFSETDPFLDDNQFELDGSEMKSDQVLNNMPTIKNIGTVKPNSMLSKIEDVTKENNDIILPTMGLVDNNKADVPIVSDNYIS